MMTMPGKLTTHVLDTANGCPASNMKIELWAIDLQSQERTLLKTISTNSDGRSDVPLIAESEMQAGIYELVFSVSEYFAQKSGSHPEIPFLDRVPIRFGIADPNAHYHVPLLASPWSYSTYRGS